MRSSAAKWGGISLAWLLLIAQWGCATQKAKQESAADPSQAAGGEQVIVVPVFIVSPPGAVSPDRATHREELPPARM